MYYDNVVFIQMIASKYLNDEGEEESLLNSEWAKIGQSGMFVTHCKTCILAHRQEN